MDHDTRDNLAQVGSNLYDVQTELKLLFLRIGTLSFLARQGIVATRDNVHERVLTEYLDNLKKDVERTQDMLNDQMATINSILQEAPDAE